MLSTIKNPKKSVRSRLIIISLLICISIIWLVNRFFGVKTYSPSTSYEVYVKVFSSKNTITVALNDYFWTDYNFTLEN